MTLSVTEGSIWSFMAGFGDTYISPFAIFLKAGNHAIAFLSTMPSLVGAFSQMIGASLTDRLGRRRDLIVPCSVIQALMYVPMIVLPFFFRSWAVPSVILCAALSIVFGHGATPAWVSMMGDVAPENRRGDYFGRRGRMVILMVFVATLMAGLVLSVCQGKDHIWAGFSCLFAVACVARLISARLLALHYDPPYKPSPEAYFSLWDFLRQLPRSNFAKFTLYVALMMGAVNLAGPFFNVYMLRDLHWSYAQFTVNTAVFLGTQFFLIRWWGRMGDRHGNRVVLVATSFLQPVLPLMWTLTTNYYFLLLVQVISGATWAGFSIAVQNFTYDAVSPPKRARVSAYVTVINGIFTIIGGTILGAFLANHLPSSYSLGPYRADFVSPLPGVFAVSSLARVLVAVIFLPRFREVKTSAERIHPVALLLRLSGCDALTGFIWQTVLRLTPWRDRKNP